MGCSVSKKPAKAGPRVLLFDIETSPILGYVWQLWDQNIALNQIHTDWHLLSWAAKWLDTPASETMYMDQRSARNIEDDRAILKVLWALLDEAEIVVTQNGVKFDQKKLNARFVIHGMQPPSSFKHIDTFLLAKKHFGFTSNKLEYMTDKLCVKYKKQKHKKFAGFELWRECLAGNLAAWREMEKYNRYDVLSLEELFKKLIPWDSTINFNLYHDDAAHTCKCGSRDFKKQGWHYSGLGKFQRYRCKKCGAETRDRTNQFSKEKQASLRLSTPRR